MSQITERGLVKRLLSDLADIKRLIGDVIIHADKAYNGPKRDQDKPDHGKSQTHGGANSAPASADPAIPGNTQSAEKKQEAFPKLTKWKPVIELVGMVVVVAYTVIAGYQGFKMREANRISREALIAVQRPFLNVKGITLNPIDSEPGMDLMEIKWENSGPLPALDVLEAATFTPPMGPSETPYRFEVPFKDNVSSAAPAHFSVGPKFEWTGASAGIAEVDWRRSIQTRAKYYLYGWTTYRDSFTVTKRHITMYCFVPNYTVGITKEGLITVDVCPGNHDCMDEQCNGEPYGPRGHRWPDEP